MKKIIAMMLVLVMSLTLVACGKKAEGFVVSCEEGRLAPNDYAISMAAYHKSKGNWMQYVEYSKAAEKGLQMYDIVVECNGVQYEIETSIQCVAGEVITFNLPRN